MSKFSTSAIAIAASLFAASPAISADIFRGSTKDTDVFSAPRSTNWTGFYIGGALGYGNANHNLTVQDYFKDYCGDSSQPDDHGIDDRDKDNRADYLGADGVLTCAKFSGPEDITPDPDFDNVNVPGGSRNLANLDGINSHGLVGDVRIGADVQRDRFVFGVFGTYGFNDMETEASALFGPDFTATASIEKGDEWSVGARVGMLVNDRTLAYVLAAYTETEYTFGVNAGPGLTGSKDVNFSGITVGGGVEFALTNNVFFGIEGTHTFYGEENIFDDYDASDNAGTRLVDELSETKVMGTLKIKLNSDLGVLGN